MIYQPKRVFNTIPSLLFLIFLLDNSHAQMMTKYSHMEYVEVVLLSPEIAILLQATGQCKNYQVVEGLCGKGVNADQDEQILTPPQI